MAKKKDTAANLGFENQLWKAADKLRGNMDAAEYKHVALGLIFLKYISDAFEARRDEIATVYAVPESEWYVAEAAESISGAIKAAMDGKRGELVELERGRAR